MLLVREILPIVARGMYHIYSHCHCYKIGVTQIKSIYGGIIAMDLAFVSNFSLFSNLTEKELNILPKYFEKASFKKDEVIYAPGQVRDKLRLIIKGRVEVTAHTYDFEEPTTIYGPGQFLGEASLYKRGLSIK